ncbi:hypothetical protein Drose_06920 [Dactylosporangium roseum]|uniref:Uncharacterized protein n=1 Tax=Dactylosporangium roseum TaxID=47989 RepID=A0ABY5Z818_9ACTN|nr:hypothetical protein [Dactylosporangium roseum]UWZ37997.1 hypothetical protein Drose_06920 [Dactylosporangium roseum]
MYSTTPDAVADELVALAEAVRAAGASTVQLYVSFGPDMFAPEPDRIADVDRLAEAFGLTAETAKGSSGWYRGAKRDHDGIFVKVDTRVSAPAQRCACGAVCEHSGAVAA